MTSQTGVAALQPELVSMETKAGTPRPRIYMSHPLLAGPLAEWGRWLDRAAELGFTHALTAPFFAGPSLFLADDFEHAHPALGWPGTAGDAIGQFAEAARARGLIPLLDVYPSQLAAAGALAQSEPRLFRASAAGHSLDPRRYGAICRCG